MNKVLQGLLVILLWFTTGYLEAAKTASPWHYFTYGGTINGKNIKVISNVFYSSEKPKCSSFTKHVKANVHGWEFNNTLSKCYLWSERKEQNAEDDRNQHIIKTKRGKIGIRRTCFQHCR